MLQVEWSDPQQAGFSLERVVKPWARRQMLSGHRLSVELRLAEDKKSDQQRAYLHAVVLTQIARQVSIEGRRSSMPTWKEYFREKYLGFKVVTFIDPITGKKHRRRVRVSTEDLGVRAYAKYTERVTAFAVTELGVVFDERAREIDPETGEIMGYA